MRLLVAAGGYTVVGGSVRSLTARNGTEVGLGEAAFSEGKFGTAATTSFGADSDGFATGEGTFGAAEEAAGGVMVSGGALPTVCTCLSTTVGSEAAASEEGGADGRSDAVKVMSPVILLE